MDKYIIAVKSEKTASRLVGEEAVILILEKQESVVLNATGAFIWESCDGKRNIEEIATILAIDFEVSAQEALKDCLEFINKMIEKDALTVKNT